MHIHIPHALLPTLSAAAAPVTAPQPEGRSFSQWLQQKQSPAPAPAKSPTPAAAPSPAKEPNPAKEPGPDGATPPAGESKARAAEAGRPTSPQGSGADAADAPAGAATAGAPATEDAEADALQTEPDLASGKRILHDPRRSRGIPFDTEVRRGAARAGLPGLEAGISLLGTRAEPDLAEAASAEAAAALDPALAQFVAELQLAAPPAAGSPGPTLPTPHPALGPEAEAPALAVGQGVSATNPALPGDLSSPQAPRDDLGDAEVEASAQTLAAFVQESRGPESAGVNAARAGDSASARQQSNRDALPAAAPFLLSSPSGTPFSGASVAGAAAPAAPHGVPDFAHTLGAQISVLAREGVQRARLNLHGGDMGAVSVQIVMDGTQAQVHFGADTAATRQAIEAGLPELATALRDAGLTLSGGDVSSRHSRGGDGARRDGDGRAAQAGSPPAADRGIEATHHVPLRRFGSAAGGVDLYA